MSRDRAVPLDVLRVRNLDCRACPLRAGDVTPVPGAGPAGARLMVVGEWPGEDEDLLGRPFEDRAGLLLRKAMRMAGLPHEGAWLCYATRCRAAGRADGGRHAADCKGWLWGEMRALSPRVVVPLGDVPTRLLLGLKRSARLGDVVGRFHDLPYLPGAAAAPWYSPAVLASRGRAFERRTVAFFEAVGGRLC